MVFSLSSRAMIYGYSFLTAWVADWVPGPVVVRIGDASQGARSVDEMIKSTMQCNYKNRIDIVSHISSYSPSPPWDRNERCCCCWALLLLCGSCHL